MRLPRKAHSEENQKKGKRKKGIEEIKERRNVMPVHIKANQEKKANAHKEEGKGKEKKKEKGKRGKRENKYIRENRKVPKTNKNTSIMTLVPNRKN